jgi:hypothetical protein
MKDQVVELTRCLRKQDKPGSMFHENNQWGMKVMAKAQLSILCRSADHPRLPDMQILVHGEPVQPCNRFAERMKIPMHGLFKAPPWSRGLQKCRIFYQIRWKSHQLHGQGLGSLGLSRFLESDGQSLGIRVFF